MTYKIPFLVIIILITGSLLFGESVPDGVKDVASASLAAMLSKIPTGDEASYGFAGRNEFDKAYIGDCYELYTTDGQSLIALDQYRFIVEVNGTKRALLTVAKVNNEYLAVDFGAVGLAMELGKKAHTVTRTGPTPSRNILLRVYSVKSDYVMYAGPGDILEEKPIYPLTSAYNSLISNRIVPEESYGFEELKMIINAIQ